MSKTKVLIVTHALEPYTTGNLISELVNKMAVTLNKKNFELRILMPGFGNINERRHRLHEVVRLSGMNIIVDDDDYPLIIKVASLPGARLQVYFLDNEDFFTRKFLHHGEDGVAFEDNVERMAFFNKGVIEIVKKFGWPPNIVHCHGWMTSLIPLYLKTSYKDDPVFRDSAVVYSDYGESIANTFSKNFSEKSAINALEVADLIEYFDKEGNINLEMGAAKYADAYISSSENLSDDVKDVIEKRGIPSISVLDSDIGEDLLSLYDSFLKEEEEED